MVDRQLGFLFGLPATLALVFVAGKYVFSDFRGNGDSRSFSHDVLLDYLLIFHLIQRLCRVRNAHRCALRTLLLGVLDMMFC